MKDIIYMEDEQINQFDYIRELYDFLLGEEYFTLTEKEKFIKRYEIAFYKIKFYNLDLDIVHTKIGTLDEQYKIKSREFDLDRAIIIDDEREFVISLSKISNITILESKDKDNLLSAKEKEKYKGNYILINDIIENIRLIK